MRKVASVVGVLLAAAASAAVFERFLEPKVPRDRAILNYLQLEKQGKATSNDLAELAVLLVEKGFPQDGEAYLRKALKLDKGNVEARYRLGLVLQRLGRDWEAVRHYRQVVKARPGFAEAQFMLALALERSGHRRAAIRAYAKAYKHNPDLAHPAKNPLVLDSKLQTQAMLRHYQRTVASATLKVPPLDPQAVRRMMLAKPPVPAPTPPPPTPAPAPSPKPEVPPPAAVVTLPPRAPQPRPQSRPGLPPNAAEKDGAPQGDEPSAAGQVPLLPVPNASSPVPFRR